MIKSLLIAGALAGAVTAPAMAGGLESHHVNAGVTVDPNGDNTSGFVGGRYNVPNIPVSLRGDLTIGDDFGGGVAVTADFGIAENINLYGGGGAAFGSGTPLNGDNDVVGVALVGIEAGIAEKVVVFADVNFGLGGETTYIPKVGVGYRF